MRCILHETVHGKYGSWKKKKTVCAPNGNLDDDFFLLLRPEFISFFLSYLNLIISVRFK